MDWLAPIAGVSVEQYAKLCANMMDTGEDTDAQAAIAEKLGVDRPTWEAAKDGFTKRMAEDAVATGVLAREFMKHYQAAQAELRGGAEPMTIEMYAKVTAEYSLEKDADGNRVPYDVVLARYGLNTTRWGEVCGYWTPRVNDPADPATARRWAELVQAESDRILGIKRGPAASAPPPQADAPSAAPRVAAPEPEPTDIVGMITKFVKSIFG